MAVHRWLENPRLGRIITAGVLIVLVLFHAVNNWRWLTANVTVLGWDVPSHLGTSFIYNDMLRPLNLRTLFSAVVWHPNRPPLFFLSAIPLYRLAGVSADVGTMVNVLYLAVLFGSVYSIGRRLGGRSVGLLAAFVVATLPMIYAISRFFYLELALTAMVTLSIYLLLASEGFENRLASLLFGLSFGLGLLTKRTYLVFLFAGPGSGLVSARQ
jgi:4-amino-4-deoxy-L-arabinose transferase-like glycosyltransferase